MKRPRSTADAGEAGGTGLGEILNGWVSSTNDATR